MKFHREHYGPRGMVIAIVGGVKPEEAVRQVKRALGGWQVKDQKETPALPPLKPLKKIGQQASSHRRQVTIRSDHRHQRADAPRPRIHVGFDRE